MNKPTIFLDASALKKSFCRRNLFYEVFEGYKEAKPGNDTVFGSAFHKFRADWRTGIPVEEALKGAVKLYTESPKIDKDNKTFINKSFLLDICLQYEEKYKNDDFKVVWDGKTALIEPVTRFAFPLYTCCDFDILAAGTMDEIGFLQLEKHYAICDIKTTGSWRKKEFMTSFKMSPQLKMYRWAVRQYAKFHPNPIWKQIDKGPVAAFIDGVFYKAGSKTEGPSVEFVRKDYWGGINYIYFKDAEIDEFGVMVGEQLKKLIIDVAAYLKDGTVPYREGTVNDTCTSKFGGCKYLGACSAPDETSATSYLNFNFVKKQYRPLLFGTL